MYLKRIEMSGFKSFADRTTIDFEQGLTAIVGPNGSGKSNVTEAIRWVLGEQSAKNLRGDKMYDVIFTGTEKRRPMNVCEVTIVLDNSDRMLPLEYDEVSVMRRLTRTGDSYYAINKKQCRLKDIVELFLDSGLGKNSFSIISQGKVEAIFDDKPENRRMLFEETAGVLKYKQRKAQAYTKLNETEENLERLEDIIYELEKQVEPLKEQVATAVKYQELTTKYQNLDLATQVQLISQNKDNYDQLAQTLQVKKQTIHSLEQETTVLKAQLESQQQKLQRVEQQLDQAQAQQVQIIEEYEQKQALQQVATERKNQTAQTKQDLKLAILEETGRKTELVAKIAQSKTKIHDLEIELAEVKTIVQAAKKKLQAFDQDETLNEEDLQNQYFEYMQKQAHLRNEKQQLQQQYQQEEAKSRRNNQQEETVKEDYLQLEKDVADLQKVLAELQKQVTRYEKQITELETTKVYEQEQVQKRQEQVQKGQALYQQVQAKYQSLKSLQENYHGFYQGVRAVLQAKQQLAGIKGAVAECLQMESQYAQAIEVAIGSAMQNIIVDNEQNAAAAIKYLKQTKNGKATFLPLNIIKGRLLAENVIADLRNMTGFVGIGSQLVTADVEFQQIVNSLLGQVIVVDNLDHANQISRQVNYQYKVVTLDGEIIRTGGAMTGGQNKQSNSLLHQQAELQELKAKLPTMQEQVANLQRKQLQKEAEVEAIDTQLQEMQKHYQDVRIDLQNQEKIFLVKEQQLKQLAKEYQLVEKEGVSSQTFFAQYDEKMATLADQETWLEQEITKLKQTLSNFSKTKEEQQQQKERLLQTVSEQETKLQLYAENIKERQTNLAELIEQKELSESKITKWQAQIEVMEQELSTDEIAQLDSKLAELGQIKQQLSQDVQHFKEQKEALSTQVTAEEQKWQSLLTTLNEDKAQYQKQHMQYEKIADQLDQKLAYLQMEYQMTFEKAKEQAQPLTISLAEADLQLKTWRNEIKALGHVNLGALEQYEELNERYTFIKTQRDDLLSAKQQLLSTMSEMDQKVKDKFKATFDAIADKFSLLFPQIFGGGNAALKLTDETDLLNTGIEIEAQPPGKKLQRLSLLSGGEKALTAITLLFAMIQVKPVPFCILDEVEAALDEANVYRFGQYLRDLDEQTQFIVITHRKGTMEAAKVLYGVTMQESGVSNLVSVKMETVAETLKE